MATVDRVQYFYQCTYGNVSVVLKMLTYPFKKPKLLTESFVARCIFVCLYIHNFVFAVNECWLFPTYNHYFHQNVYVFRRHIKYSVVPRKCMVLNQTALCQQLMKKKGLQSVTGADVKSNSAQYVIVNCSCTVYSVVRSGRNYSDFLNWCVYCSGLLRIQHVKHLNMYNLSPWAPHSAHLNSDTVFDVLARSCYHFGCQKIWWFYELQSTNSSILGIFNQSHHNK